MMKVHEKLTDINQIKAHNQIKETKLKVGGAALQRRGPLQPATAFILPPHSLSAPQTHPHPSTGLRHLPAHRLAHHQHHLRPDRQYRVGPGVAGALPVSLVWRCSLGRRGGGAARSRSIWTGLCNLHMRRPAPTHPGCLLQPACAPTLLLPPNPTASTSHTHETANPLQVCDQAPETIYGTIVADKVNSDTDLAQAVGQIVYTAQAIMENAANQVGVVLGGWWG